ncbi:SIR2 family protein [Amedibacillus dolichus]|uniref:SIR2-like domain-containing protein n=1 Tax=Amedibacillus dolichus DSM 3991 TaxID=428127 RepID=A8R8Y6_9FIRM|nr:hypothetical protein [Amedibacillus dolichus]EDP11874.1 hypothetical protein EUBDOL_00431 [Amedibacillus dolichus DSM 3991]
MVVKLKKDASFIIGNGFNFYLKNYLKSEEFKIDREEKIKGVSYDSKIQWLKQLENVLEEYCYLMDPIKSENSNTSGKFFLKDLDDFCNKMTNSNAMDMVMNQIETMIANKIEQSMSKEGESSPPLTARSIFKIKKGEMHSWFYSCLENTFKDVGIEKIHAYTTNYDDLIDRVLSTRQKSANVVHLHGYYDEPNSIVCCSPNKKADKTKRKLKELSVNLEKSKIVVLFGLGLESDPHIREVLNQMKDRQFIIIEANPAEYFVKRIEKLEEYQFLKNNYIYFINTAKCILDNSKLREAAKSPELLIERLQEILADIYK